MDACHLLLGRPWKFDKETIRDGKKNDYIFKKDGSTFKIQYLLDEGETQPMGPNILFVDENEFIDTLREGEGVGHAIMVKPSKEKEYKKIEMSTEVQEILS